MDDVQGFLLRYRAEFEGIDRWQDKIVGAARGSGVIRTPLGRLLRVTTDTPVNSLYNFPFQATASDGFKRALVAIDQGIRGLDARIIQILHDEVIVESRMEEAVAVAEIVRRSMEGAFEEMLPGIRFGVKTERRERWGA